MSSANTTGQRCGSVSPYHELSVGESIGYTGMDGAPRTIKLEAVDDRSATVRVNAFRVKIPLGHFSSSRDILPPGDVVSVVEIEGLRVGAEVTRAFMKGTKYSLSLLNLHRDARLYVAEAEQPMSPVGTHVFPLPDFQWEFGDHWLVPVPYGWHLGIDMFADCGHPLVCITDGNVVAIRHHDAEHEKDDYWGNNLGLLGDDGILYCYMHWDHLAEGIDVGSRLKAGDYIGPVGRSGFERMSIRPHLHFEMMMLRHPQEFYFAYELEPEVLPTPNRVLQPEVEGHVINPYPYLVEWYLGS